MLRRWDSSGLLTPRLSTTIASIVEVELTTRGNCHPYRILGGLGHTIDATVSLDNSLMGLTQRVAPRRGSYHGTLSGTRVTSLGTT